MNSLKANYEECLLRLRQARRAMRRFMAASGDWATKLQVEEEFGNVQDVCRDFASRQYGLGWKPVRRNSTPDRNEL